jgi:hypothetical protein
LSYSGAAILKAKDVKVRKIIAMPEYKAPEGVSSALTRDIDRPRIGYAAAGLDIASIPGDERLEVEWGGLDGNEPYLSYVFGIVQPEREVVVDLGMILLTPNRRQLRERESNPDGLLAKLPPEQQQKMIAALISIQPAANQNDLIIMVPDGSHLFGASIAALLAGKAVDGSTLEQIRAVVPQ